VAAHRPEVADVLREHGATYVGRGGASADQQRVLADLVRCRTAALGGHLRRCDHCGHEEIAYNSCRNRHCPKCQGPAAARWLAAHEAELLDVPYFHVVFTLPAEIGPLALQNRRVIYSLLFRAASQTLMTIARDPKHLGAEIGFLCVLHTWGQNLHHHPHMHCVVPGGGLAPAGQRWLPSRQRFLLSVRVLRRFFRGCFLRHLDQAFQQKKLEFHGDLTTLAEPQQWPSWLKALRRKPWVVYSKPPFGGPQQVLRYLARYTHRIAISNRRILGVENGQVRFRWKDYRRGGQSRVMTLEAGEFVRRFLLHVLPKGFQRIRQYGFLANRAKAEKLALCRRLLAEGGGESVRVNGANQSETPESSLPQCPICRQGQMRVVAEIDPVITARAPPSMSPAANDRRAA
jgi:hypothetical protein